jgi:acyl carrier protein
MMPPVKGCINASMALQDALFDKMTHEQWSLAVASKVSTSWNLHTLLPSNLDFFILLSSVFGTLGSIAQSNYSAGCSYQDALARHRLSQNPPQKAVSIDVGWMRSVGIVAETEAFARTRQNAADLWEIEAFELTALLDVLCDPSRPPAACIDKAQVLIGLKTPADFFATSHSKTSSSLSLALPQVLTKAMFSGFSPVVESSNIAEPNEKAEVEDAAQLFKDASSVQDKADVVVKAIMKKVATALVMVRDDVDPSKPLSHYGVDSLMSVELRNWIGRDFSAKLEEIDMMGGGRTISDIGHLVVEKSK